MATNEQPNSYLFLSIAQTVLCCLPIGIYCIYLSTKVQDAINKGNLEEAQMISAKTKKFNFIGIGLGLVVSVIITAITIMGAIAQSTNM